MKNTESRTKEILNWLGEVADHAPLFENMAMFRDTVERLLSVLRAGNWREVHTGRRCMRLEVTYDYAAWERLMEQVEAALAQQPAAVGVDEGSRSVTRQLLHWGGVPVHVTGTVTTSPGNWSLIDAAQAQPKRRPYNASGSLSEYGVFPECDAQPLEAQGDK